MPQGLESSVPAGHIRQSMHVFWVRFNESSWFNWIWSCPHFAEEILPHIVSKYFVHLAISLCQNCQKIEKASRNHFVLGLLRLSVSRRSFSYCFNHFFASGFWLNRGEPLFGQNTISILSSMFRSSTEDTSLK